MLERPDKLYRLTSERARRTLNQTIFTRLYVDADDAPARVHDDEPTAPFAPVIAVHRAEKRESGGIALLSDTTADTTTALLATALTGGCSSKAAWVEVAGIEPASFGTKTGLLRAQPAWRFLGPGAHAGVSPTGSAAVWFPCDPRGRGYRLSLLTMPGPEPETLSG